MAWLKEILTKAGDRKVVLFSHHQLYSHSSRRAEALESPGFRSRSCAASAIFAWYWGHEHRCIDLRGPRSELRNSGALHRPRRHAGKPQGHAQSAARRRASLRARRMAAQHRAQTSGRQTLPNVVVLEGPNEYIKGEEDKFSPHGYAVLSFDGPLSRSRSSIRQGQVIYEKTWSERHGDRHEARTSCATVPPARSATIRSPTRSPRSGQLSVRRTSRQRAAGPVGARQAAQRRNRRPPRRSRRWRSSCACCARSCSRASGKLDRSSGSGRTESLAAGSQGHWSGSAARRATDGVDRPRRDQDGKHVGTGFLVADGLLATNRHVLGALTFGAEVLAQDRGAHRLQAGGRTATNSATDIVAIAGVAAIHRKLDMVLLTIPKLGRPQSASRWRKRPQETAQSRSAFRQDRRNIPLFLSVAYSRGSSE